MIQPWFTDARFGLFIHWGIYAIPGNGEWFRFSTDDGEEYERYAETFNPVDFDPAAWADKAWRAGMRYVVFTTKHHDGFCMFDSHYTDYKITNTPYGRDITAMLVEAFRQKGFRIGLYHSLIDWHHPHYLPDQHHPLGKNGQLDFPDRDPAIYRQYLYNSVEQLMTEYGKIDLLFWDYTTEWKSPLDWNPDQLLAMIYQSQPDIIINDRMSFDRKSYTGDYRTPEIAVPNVPPRQFSKQTPWETCATMNGCWGYIKGGGIPRPVEAITTGLIGCIAKDGNLLLNLGPDEKGNIPDNCLKLFDDLADWFQYSEEAVRACKASGFKTPDGYLYTQNNDKLYLYIPCPPMADILLPELLGQIKTATLLRTGEEVAIRTDWGLEHSPLGEVRLSIGIQLKAGDIIKLELC